MSKIISIIVLLVLVCILPSVLGLDDALYREYEQIVDAINHPKHAMQNKLSNISIADLQTKGYLPPHICFQDSSCIDVHPIQLANESIRNEYEKYGCKVLNDADTCAMAAEMTDEHFPDEVTHRQEVIALYAYTLASFMYFGNHELREKQGVGVNSTLKVPILMTISGLAFLAQHNDIQADMKEHVDEQGHIYVYRGEGESPRRHPHCHYNEGFPVFERQSEYNMLWGFTSTSLSLGMARDYASLNGVVMMTALNVDPTNNTENRQRKRSNTIIGRKSIRLVDTAIDSTNNGNGSDGTYDTTFASGSYLGPISMEDQYEVVLVPSTRLKVIGCERMTYMVETTPINHTVEYSYDVSLRGDLSSVQEDDLLVQLRAAYLKNVRNEEIKAAEEKAREDREAEEANEKADTPEGEISDDVEDFVNILRKFVEIEVEH